MLLPVVLLAIAACTPPGPSTCKLTDATTCTNGLVCERVTGEGNPYCVQPVQLSGTVKVFGGTAAIGNAEIIAVDSKGIAIGPMVKSDSDGTWTMRVVADRSDLKGAPIFRTVSLRVQAQDHFAFPSVIRTAQPIDMSGATAASTDKPWIFASALTDVTLTVLPDGEKGNKGVAGTLELATTDAALVVLEGASRHYATVADSTGAFHLMNVIPGAYKAQAYAKGVNFTAVDVTAAAGAESPGVSVKKDAAATMTATITGSVQLVPGSNGAGTSVVLFPASTFSEALTRGERVPGLRAPESGTPNLTGQYTISGIPNGAYVAVVASDNDGNVRDPDPAIAMAQIARVIVTAGAGDNNPVFKVAGAIETVSPGAADAVEEVAGTPTFTWKPFDGATVYELSVYTQQGTLTWGKLGILEVKNAQGNVTQAYEGPMLKPGVVYQWRLMARGALLKPVSLTEDLKGLFSVK